MKKIAIISSSTALEGEKGLNRMFSLAKLVSEHGFETEFITSRFQHWTKSQREGENVRYYGSLKVTLLEEPGYRKNVDVRRIVSHYQFARHLKAYLETQQYDLVYCAIPDNRTARVAGEYAHKKQIPFVVDIEDLWPEAMRMKLDIPLISDVLFSYYTRDARKTYQLANAVIGSSDTYRDEPLKYHITIDKKLTVYVGNDVAAFDEGVKENHDQVHKPEGAFWVTYAGSLGASYDIATLIKAGHQVNQDGYKDVQIILCGDGPTRAELEALAKELNSQCEFKGYLPFKMMAAILEQSDLTVNSLVKKAPQSFVSKIGDYLAAGKPMISTCLDQEFWQKVERDGFGVNVMPEDVTALAKAIEELHDDPKRRTEMSSIARKLALQEFNRPKAYLKIVNLIDELTK